MVRLSSPRLSLVTLSAAVIVGMTVVGVGLAQLTIPTTLSNATIYIKDLLVTTDGTSSTSPKIALDGAAGTVTIANLVNTPVLGVNANGQVIPQTSATVYNYIASQVSGAITNTMGNYTGFVICPYSTGCVYPPVYTGNGGGTSGDNGRYYNPKGETPENTGVVDIYFADPNFAGTGGLVRIGMQDPANNNSSTVTYTQNDLNNSQLIVKGDIESRTAIKIRTPLNPQNKDKVYVGSDRFQSSMSQGGINNTSLLVRSDTRSGGIYSSSIILGGMYTGTKVGINTLSNTLPTATLDIANVMSTNGSTKISLDSKVGSLISNASAASISHMMANNAYDASLNLGTVSSSFVATQKVKVSSSGDSYFNGGNVGIGTSSPQTELHVVGDVRADAYYYNSDRRLKTDINIIDNALDLINTLHGYTFTWKSNGKKAIGLIAQEVELVFPDLVDTDAYGFKSVQYGNLVAPIIEAIHTLTDQIQTLFDKYVSQQKQIDSLEARITHLESLVRTQ